MKEHFRSKFRTTSVILSLRWLKPSFGSIWHESTHWGWQHRKIIPSNWIIYFPSSIIYRRLFQNAGWKKTFLSRWAILRFFFEKNNNYFRFFINTSLFSILQNISRRGTNTCVLYIRILYIFVYVYVYVYVYICICICKCIYIYVNVYLYIYIFIYLYIYIFIYLYIYIFIYLYIYIFIYLYIYIFIYLYIYIFIYLYIYIFIYMYMYMYLYIYSIYLYIYIFI